MRRLMYLLPVLVLGVMALFFVKGLGMTPTTSRSVLLNTPVPEMNLGGLPGRGATGCRPPISRARCRWSTSTARGASVRRGAPVLLEIKKSGLVPIYGIDWRDEPALGAAYLARHGGNPYERVGVDPAPGRTAVAFGVTGAPETFIVDKQGIIRLKYYAGPITAAVWAKILLPKIKELQAQ